MGKLFFGNGLNLVSLAREALPEAADLEDARRFFAYVCGSLESPADGVADTPARAWISRVMQRGMEIWTDEVVGDRLVRIDWVLHKDRPGYRPPVPIDPARLPPDAPGQSVHRYELRQQAGELVFAAAQPGTLAAGSLLSLVRTANRLVRVAGSAGQPGAEPVLLRLDAAPSPARCALPSTPTFFIHTDRERLTFRRLTQPAWASAIGRDRFGLWCEIAVEPSRGEPVIQRLRWIPPGRFWMGSQESETRGLAKNDDERDWFKREQPQHQVILTQGYWLFDAPCTQVLWEAVMGDNPSRFQSLTRPVEQVSWNQAQEFLQRINGRFSDLNLTLPSEAQWEYACRAGTETAIYAGELAILGQCNAPALDPIAWYSGNSGVEFDLDNGYDSSGWPEKQYPHSRAGTRPVKLKQPNAWGLYDMLGNVWEWCQDGLRDYTADAVIDPVGPVRAGAGRVIRGGSWSISARIVRAACRHQYGPDDRNVYLGFRCARVQGRELGGSASPVSSSQSVDHAAPDRRPRSGVGQAAREWWNRKPRKK